LTLNFTFLITTDEQKKAVLMQLNKCLSQLLNIGLINEKIELPLSYDN